MPKITKKTKHDEEFRIKKGKPPPPNCIKIRETPCFDVYVPEIILEICKQDEELAKLLEKCVWI